MEGTKYYTTDGFEAEVGRCYLNEHGEQVFLDEVVENQDGAVRYMVTPFYEGDAMDMVCYGGPPTERTISYEVEGAQTIVKCIFKNEPTAKLGEKTKATMAKLEAMALTIGKLAMLEEDLKSQVAALKREQKNELSAFEDLMENGKARVAHLSTINDEISEKRQQLSELEDSIGGHDAKDGIVTIRPEELGELRKRDFKLLCLVNGGVDNWNFYDESLRKYRERYPEG